MRKLNRGTNAPTCLGLYHCDHHPWRPSDAEKDEIWQALNAMQNHRCAYCEADISTLKSRHIEHFASRTLHRDRTYLWENLFGSCVRKESCGTYKDDKDTAPYDWAQLIKPDLDDPDDYLVFVATGEIVPRHDLNDADLHRAKETLRVFNLDAEVGPLRQLRKAEIRKQLDSYETTFELWSADPNLLDLDAELQTLLDDAKTMHPFFTAIRHALTARHQS